jgi:hypothetical protein
VVGPGREVSPSVPPQSAEPFDTAPFDVTLAALSQPIVRSFAIMGGAIEHAVTLMIAMVRHALARLASAMGFARSNRGSGFALALGIAFIVLAVVVVRVGRTPFVNVRPDLGSGAFVQLADPTRSAQALEALALTPFSELRHAVLAERPPTGVTTRAQRRRSGISAFCRSAC